MSEIHTSNDDLYMRRHCGAIKDLQTFARSSVVHSTSFILRFSMISGCFCPNSIDSVRERPLIA